VKELLLTTIHPNWTNQCYASEFSKENCNTTHIYIITVNDKPIKFEEIYEDSTRKGKKKDTS